MIDQAKDKKDGGLKQKLDKENSRKSDAKKTLNRLDDPPKAVLNKGMAQASDKGGSNGANAMAPIGSATIIGEEEVEVHSGPSKSGTSMPPLRSASKVDILGRFGDELKILVDGQVGYIDARRTDYEDASLGGRGAKPIGSASVMVSAIHVRQGAGKDFDSLGVLSQADKVNVYGEKDGFLEIHLGDAVGYIAAEYTDYVSQAVGDKDKKSSNALAQSPEALRELMAKEDLTEAEMLQARTWIKSCPEELRGDLFEALQRKSTYEASQRRHSKAPVVRGDGEGLECLAACLRLLGVRNPNSELPYETYLEQVKRDQKIPGQNSMASWGAIANAMGVSYHAMCLPGDRKGLEKAFWGELIKEQLRQGNAIMASIQNHTVRVESVEEKGLVVTMPESDNQGFTGLGSGYQECRVPTIQKSNGRCGILAYESLGQASLQWVIALH